MLVPYGTQFRCMLKVMILNRLSSRRGTVNCETSTKSAWRLSTGINYQISLKRNCSVPQRTTSFKRERKNSNITTTRSVRQSTSRSYQSSTSLLSHIARRKLSQLKLKHARMIVKSLRPNPRRKHN